MKHRARIYVTITLVIIIAWISWLYVKPYLGFNSNKLVVIVERPLIQDKLTIETGFFSIDRKSDRELFNPANNIIFKGKELKQISNDYGENDFLIKYADSCYFQFRHFKTNCKQRDTYKFIVFLRNGRIYINVKIKGTDPMEFDRCFNLIKNADSLICNVPKKNAGYLYNMIELVKNK